MKSSLYECHVMHARFSPRSHRFAYRIFYFAIDLDELAALDRMTFFSVNRWNVYSFREADYLPTHEALHNAGGEDKPSPASATQPVQPTRPGALKARVVAYLGSHGIDLAGGRVVLVTLPRVFGYGFNPVSFYFCYDRAGAPAAAIAEVANTFKEMKPFFIGSPSLAPGSPSDAAASGAVFRRRAPKHFYVSPFSDVDVAFDFNLRLPDERLVVEIDDYIGAERTLATALTGARRDLADARLAWFTLKYPLVTAQVMALIHWHAFKLWLKRVPWFAKAARPGDQRALYRPHRSLLQPSDSA